MHKRCWFVGTLLMFQWTGMLQFLSSFKLWAAQNPVRYTDKEEPCGTPKNNVFMFATAQMQALEHCSASPVSFRAWVGMTNMWALMLSNWNPTLRQHSDWHTEKVNKSYLGYKFALQGHDLPQSWVCAGGQVSRPRYRTQKRSLSGTTGTATPEWGQFLITLWAVTDLLIAPSLLPVSKKPFWGSLGSHTGLSHWKRNFKENHRRDSSGYGIAIWGTFTQIWHLLLCGSAVKPAQISLVMCCYNLCLFSPF